jgi:Nif-specific regulatory protein
MAPPHEAKRLEALHSYSILNSPTEPEFDQLAQLAAYICDTPMAAISLVDADQQWFKARVGIVTEQTPRNISFCQHTILNKTPSIVPDALRDVRFAASPLVTGEPHIRFYLGIPLLTPDGYALGALCVLDRVPRQLNQHQIEAMQCLGQQVVSQIELRKTRHDLTLSEEFKTRLIETSQDCIKVLDLEGHLLTMNAGGMRVLEICDFTPLCNSLWFDFWQEQDRLAAEAAVKSALQNQTGRFTGYCATMNGKPMWWDVIVSPIHDDTGKIICLLAVSREITERVVEEKRWHAIVEGTVSTVGHDFFRSMVMHLVEALRVKVAFVTECANVEKTRARMLAFWDGKGLADSFEYEIRNTTCERVYQGETCFYARDLQKLFPAEKESLEELNGQSYIGLPVNSSSGELIGHLAVIDDAPMDAPRGLEILRIFAARVSAELERLKAENELRQAMAEVERLKNQLHAENVYLREEIRQEHNFDDIVGNSPAILEVLHNVELVAPTDSTILILGETGTGKELIARAIHHCSQRRDRPLVKVNCGAISAGLVESELFGHVRGAFTGAHDKRAGRFELAHGGTLFLDEVGELPLDTQVRLLRVLQEGEFEPVGSSKTIRVDVRIIAATNRDLENQVKAERFRSDLYYRLNVLPLTLPALRERREDIPQLALFFLSRFARRFGKKMDGIAQETLEMFLNYSWPGNIRELQNIVERGVVTSRNSLLTVNQQWFASGSSLPAVPAMVASSVAGQHSSSATAAPGAEPELSKAADTASTAMPEAAPQTLAEIERQTILDALQKSHWVIEGEHGAARILNLHPNTLRSRLKKLGIRRPAHQIS